VDWLMYMLGNFWFWCVGVPVLAVAAVDITKRVIRHRERMAMIRHGMDPDRHRASRAASMPPAEAGQAAVP
jgi:hypothetical protein